MFIKPLPAWLVQMNLFLLPYCCSQNIVKAFTPFFSLLAACVSGEQEPFLEPSMSPWDLQSLAEEETRLPCRFNVSNSEIKVVQVMWVRENSNGDEEQIITAHFSEGQKSK